MNKSFFKSILSVFALVVVCSVNAQEISKEVALQKAQAFLSKDADSHQSFRRTPRQAPQLVLANDSRELYIFNDEANGGYVVVSGDERMPDVLGYSYDGHYDAKNIPCNMKAWLDGYASQVKYLQSHPEASIATRSATDRAPISPLLTCEWDQSYPFNLKCPELADGRCLTGCVPTAMAQIMSYHKWPKQTSGVIPGYTTYHQKIVMPDIPITTIDWDNMVDTYYVWEYQTDAQKEAVATLMLLCGVSIRVDYDTWGSGGNDGPALKAFLNYFDYDDAISELYRDWFDADEWDQIIYDELYNGRPVYYGGYGPDMGHAMVVDGYSKDGFFHVNFGWSNASNPDSPDGYYLFAGPLWGFNSNQSAFVNLKPASPDSPKMYAVLENEKLTFYYDKNKDTRSGVVIPHLRAFPSDSEIPGITECEFDPSFADYELWNLGGFFCNTNQNLKSISGLNNLNTSNVRSMWDMFMGCSSVTSLDISQWNTSNVINMCGMFEGCSSLKKLDLSRWDTSNVTDMSSMFARCSSLEDLNIKGFNTSKVTDMCNMFSCCQSLNSLDISSFKTDKTENMWGMFQGLEIITSLDVSHFNTSNVIGMDCMFSGCYNLTSLDLSCFNTDNVTNMGSMFAYCSKLENLDISSFNTSKVQDISEMFSGCSALENLDLSHFNTENVTGMKNMFCWCDALKSLNLNNFNTSKVTDMAEMFYHCSSLEKLDLDGFNTENVTNMRSMFFVCDKLTSLDLSSFNTMNVTNMQSMFCSCKSLTTIYVSEGWKNDKVENADWLFSYCKELVGGWGTTYDENHIGLDYAHIDGGPENPGYFTYKESTGFQLPIKEEEAVCPAVYSMSGIKVRAEGKGTEGLPAGVYIVGGKKIVVK